MAPPFIKLEDVWKIYQFGKTELCVLKGINLEIAKGSFTVILGSSGSGKSTLLNIISCLDAPTRGKVYFEGEEVSRFSERKAARVRGEKIGFVFQQFNLLPNFNALENVMLPMVFQGVPEKKRQERAETVLAFLGLKERPYHKPMELSGGEQQRVAIARALVNNPEMVVADEPTGNLDSVTGKKIIEILLDLNEKEKKTVIMVTHETSLANYGKEVIRIKDGEIVAKEN